MGGLIPLSDASRRPSRFSVITTTIIILNVVVFIVELTGGDEFVKQWSIIPADIVAGRHWITILTAMFMHGGWMFLPSTVCFRSELVHQVFYCLFFLLQSFAESASVGMVDFQFEEVEAVLQEFLQILFFSVINIKMDHACSPFQPGSFGSWCLQAAQLCPAPPRQC